MILCVDNLGVDFAGASGSFAGAGACGSERGGSWVTSTAGRVLSAGLSRAV